MTKIRPFHLALAILWSACALVLWQCRERNDGHLVYALDDPYIHMAMARNLAEHGVWGLTPHRFTSSSSSPLWTLILGVSFRLFGVSEAVPLILNLLLASWLLWSIERVVAGPGMGERPTLALLVAVVFVAPLPALVFCGLEHTLHICLCLLFVELAVGALTAVPWAGRALPGRDELALAALAPFLVMARYEGLFCLLVVGLGFAARRRLLVAGLVVGCGLAPVIACGAISAWNGWFWLPNPVVLKGASPDLWTAAGWAELLGRRLFGQLTRAPHLTSLLVLAFALLIQRWATRPTVWERPTVRLFVFTALSLWHLELAGVGWFYRYEAYLVVLGLVALSGALAGSADPMRAWLAARPRSDLVRLALLGLALPVVIVGPALLSPLAGRAWLSLVEIPTATANTYQQQYQMGLFLRDHYAGAAVAAVDIGAISFLGRIDCLDLMGLADPEVARLRRSGKLDPEALTALAARRRCRIAVVYDDWLDDYYGGVPRSWPAVGRWKIGNLLVAGSDRVTFHALSPAEVPRLTEALRRFAPRLPPGVQQAGPYLR
ncbi:MAG: hypothetical protein HY815_21255 [Candidatus Riflebacteria bacterium]|nr:hypothetical protein [Candidatus Riflebacteria bacterium]